MSKELKVVLFGATGMIGSGVLRSCLEDPGVSAVLVVGRSACGVQHPKLQELLQPDLFDVAAYENRLAGYNTCLFPLGVSSVGMNEADYTHITYDLTLAVAEAMLRQNPGCSFCYVSGQSTDSTEQGKVMWARVKGRIENKLLSLPFQPAVMIRPAGIQPLPGVRSKTPLYRIFYAFLNPIFPFMVRHYPGFATTSLRVGRAMLKAARGEAGQTILESVDINRLGV